MSDQSNHNEYSEYSENDEINGNGVHNYLHNAFRAWLHTVITAEQFGQGKRLPHLPGSQTEGYCFSLAKLPHNTLAGEFARPICAVLAQIDRAAMYFQRHLNNETAKDNATCETNVRHETEIRQILWQLDFALALILRRLPSLALRRAKRTECPDLLCAVTCEMTAQGSDMVNLLRSYQQVCPDQFHPTENGQANVQPAGRVPSHGVPPPIKSLDVLGDFAWDTYQRVEALDRLADEFPASLRIAARQMHAWPMLIHRHHANQNRAQELADRLELGVDYPLDASEAATFRPDTPMARYLDLWVHNLDYIRCTVAQCDAAPTAENPGLIRECWAEAHGELPSDEITTILLLVPQLPPLTKATANKWAEKALVPLIMLTDALDWENCEDPALQRIARQSGVKSQATFKSRLLAAVSASLRRLARPD